MSGVSKVFLGVLTVLSLAGRAQQPSAQRCILGQNLKRPITASSLRAFFEQQKVRASDDAIDALICCLPDSMRTDPPYVHKTRSLQAASREEPRFILADEDADTILGISGGSGDVEMIRKQASSESFSLSFHHFNPGKQGGGEDPHPDCARCHHGRYNWDSYFLWPGLYGDQDDVLADSDKESWAAFLENRPKLPRYRCLVESGKLGDENRRNLHFGRKLGKQNIERVASLIQKSEKLKPFRWALLANAFCPQGASDSPFVKQERLRAQVKILQDLRIAYNTDRRNRMGALGTSVGRRANETFSKREPEEEPAMAFYREIETLAGVDTMKEWSLVFRENPTDLNPLNVDDGYTRFLQDLMHKVENSWTSGVIELKRTEPDRYSASTCRKLSELSRAQLIQIRK